MTRETTIQTAVQLAASEQGIRLWRNNSGVATNPNGQPVRYGLGNTSERINKVFKSSDLIGVMPDGRFIAVECKTPGWRGPRTAREHAQENFLRCVRESGGVGMFVTSVEDFRECLKS